MPGDKVTQSTVDEFANGLSLAVGQLSPDSKQSFAESNPRLALGVDAMNIIVESVTGAPAGAPVGTQICSVVADVVTQISSGQGLVGSTVASAAASAGAAANAIPMVGQLVAQVVSMIGGAIAAAGISPAEDAALNQRYHETCQSCYRPHMFGYLQGTGPGGIDPADMVAQGDVRIDAIQWLAGAGSRDPTVRAKYQQWLNAAAPKYKITGIPTPVARDIVRLLEGIHAARRDPDCVTCEVHGDNGRFLFGMLMQILLDQSRKKTPAWTLDSLNSLADWYIAPRQQYCVHSDFPSANVTCKYLGPCSKDDHQAFAKSVVGMVIQWKATVEEEGNWKDAEAQVAAMPKLSRLNLSPSATGKLMVIADAAEQKQNKSRWLRGMLIAGGMTVAGGAAFVGARHLASR